MRGCALSSMYINVCNCDMFSVVYVYLEHLKFCVVCIDGRRYVCCSECNVVSNKCNEPTSCLVQPIAAHGGKVMYFGYVCFRGELGFLICDDVCMCVVNTQFELFEFVFGSVYVDLQYDEISLTFTAGSVALCCVCGHVVVFGLSVCGCGGCCDCDACTGVVLHVCLLRECDGVRLTAMLVWGMDEVWRVRGMWVVHVVQVLCLAQLVCYG